MKSCDVIFHKKRLVLLIFSSCSAKLYIKISLKYRGNQKNFVKNQKKGGLAMNGGTIFLLAIAVILAVAVIGSNVGRKKK